MKKRGRSGKPAWQKEIAGERMEILMGLAQGEFAVHPERSDRYAELARKIGMRYNVKVPREAKVRTCRGCKGFLVPGKNAVVRTNAKTLSLETRCLKCGKVSRHPYAREKMA
jgi:ribonuclease P protein subunit RPR2